MTDLVLLEKARLSVRIMEISDLLGQMRAFLRTSIDFHANRKVLAKIHELEVLAEKLGDRLLQLEATPPVSKSRQ